MDARTPAREEEELKARATHDGIVGAPARKLRLSARESEVDH